MMARTSKLLIAVTTSLALVAAGACGGDTESGNGSGGSGGKKLDSGPDVAAEVGLDAASDVKTDVSQDVSLDQSGEAALPDGDVLEGSLFDLEMPDVSLNDSGATLQGCYDCAVANCATQMAACEANDKCRTVLLCLFGDQCFGGPLGSDMTCLLGCATKAGVFSPSDPSVGIATGAAQCISGACRADCAMPGDAGLPFDTGLSIDF